jgi:cation diffusion facilitator CzcD-associated flavoprotein CzcO
MNDVSLPMVSETKHVVRWLAAFEHALSSKSEHALRNLFGQEVHWRDLMAFTWTITPHDSPDLAIASLLERQADIQASNFRLAANRTAPRTVMRHGVNSIEAFFTFETRIARCSGLVRLAADQPDRAWVLATTLDELKGHEEPVGLRRPTGDAYSRNFGGDNWSDLRRKDSAYQTRDPAVLIVGAGQAGLAIGARLRLLGVDALIVDKRERVGDIWRDRYHSLALHNQVKLNHMPYLPWPPNWPKYLPKDMIAGWLETYSWAMECNVWNNTEFLGASYDEAEDNWSVSVRQAGGEARVLRPRHLILANGIAGKPLTPKLPGLDAFKGTVIHTHDYREGARWKGKKVLVVGVGTSAHDVAQDLQGHGAHVKMIQRGPCTVASIKAAGLVHSVYYEEDLPLEDCDMIAAASSYPLLVRAYQAAVKKMKIIDKDLLEGLAAKGFKLDWGEDETGHQMKFRRRHGGYYLNAGCSELIVSGDIGLLQHEDTDEFVESGLLMHDGSVEEADLIVTATGYQSQEAVVREMLGDEIANKVGQIWGIALNGEIANMFVTTPQKGLWFSGGGFAHSRIYSHYIAMGIKVRELDFIN